MGCVSCVRAVWNGTGCYDVEHLDGVCCQGTSVVADGACRGCLLADVHSCLYTSLQASYAVNSQGCCMQQLHMQHQDLVGRLQSG